MDYISEHVWQTYRQEQKNGAWQLYVAESLRCISENTAKFAGGTYMTAKWEDIVNPKPAETRTPEEVVEHVLGQLRNL